MSFNLFIFDYLGGTPKYLQVGPPFGDHKALLTLESWTMHPIIEVFIKISDQSIFENILVKLLQFRFIFYFEFGPFFILSLDFGGE